MKFISNVKNYLKQLAAIYHMGFELTDRASLAIYLVYFTVLRHAKCAPQFKKARPVKINVSGKPATLLIKHQLDFDVYHDTFIKEEYDFTPTQQPQIILDLGSNIGSTAVYFAVKYPNAHIYCFEPDPENIKRFEQNTSPFKNRITLIPKAVWKESNKTLTFYVVPNRHWSSSLVPREGAGTEVEVNTVSLDDAMLNLGLEHIDILKFDIEGAEYEVFSAFKHSDAVETYIGEVHPKLMNKSTQDIIDLFPNHFSAYREPILTLNHKK